MTLRETRDEALIRSFTKGNGIMRRLMGGFSTPADIHAVVSETKNVFLVANDGERDVGFVCLFPLSGGYAIHLCLRTVGEKTKKIVKMAFQYANHYLYANHIYAIYPKSARAVTALCRYFGFKEDKLVQSTIHSEFPEPYSFERLDLV